jgi:hypothetical protein
MMLSDYKTVGKVATCGGDLAVGHGRLQRGAPLIQLSVKAGDRALVAQLYPSAARALVRAIERAIAEGEPPVEAAEPPPPRAAGAPRRIRGDDAPRRPGEPPASWRRMEGQR